MSSQQAIYALNRGNISRLALARLDLKRLAMASEIDVNFMPRALGSTMLRPGLEYINTEPDTTHLLEFVFAADDSALIELHDETMTVTEDDVRRERDTVTAVINNGDFTANVAGWSNTGIPGTWVAGTAKFVGTGTAIADLYQNIVCNEVNTYHGVRVVVSRGVIGFRVATAYAGTDYVNLQLGVGEHSIEFLPSGNFTIVFYNQSTVPAAVDSVSFESGVMSLPTPWAEDDLPLVREFQSGDVVFVACRGHQQRRIVRTGLRSWSCELYAPTDGPFRTENVSTTTLTASALTGEITVTASGALANGPFRAGHVGALFRITSVGQEVSTTGAANGVFTPSIRITGVGDARTFTVIITGNNTASTVSLQRSFDDVTWANVGAPYVWTADVAGSVPEIFDNQIVYYRLFLTTRVAPDVITMQLSIPTGSITGVVRVIGFTSQLVVSAEVITTLGGTTATDVWAEGAWSDYRGWPTAVTILDGRLWWAGKDRFWGSVVDAYASFDPDYEGDAGPVSRSIGFGPVDTINWLLPMDRLMAGTASSEITCQSSAFDEPLTATNFTPKETSTQGSANIQALKVDDKVIFVQRCGTRVYELAASSSSAKFVPEDLSALNPEACSPGVAYMSVQRQPDTRLHLVLTDGTVAVLLFDKDENLICWVKVETDGVIEDVAVLPGIEEDSVYYVVRRTFGGVESRFLEKWALESDCQGGAFNKQADSFIAQSGGPLSNTIVNLGRFEGQEVIVWAAGAGAIGSDRSPGVGMDQVRYTVTGGQITDVLGDPFNISVVGLPYEARFKSTKLAYMVPPGKSGLNARNKIGYVGLVMADVHAKGLEYGPSFDVMDPLPEVEAYEEVDQDAVREAYNGDLIEFPGEWSTDSRLCLRATAPRPATIMGVVIDITTNPKKP